jgi:hypothetical protein
MPFFKFNIHNLFTFLFDFYQFLSPEDKKSLFTKTISRELSQHASLKNSGEDDEAQVNT